MMYDDRTLEEATGDFTNYYQYIFKSGRFSLLEKKIDNLTCGDSLNVAFLGGSITVGAGATDVDHNSWRALVGNYFTDYVRKKHSETLVVGRMVYPSEIDRSGFSATKKGQITVNNMASCYGATSTWYSIFQIDNDLKLQNAENAPDIAFIEFSYNDMCAGDVGKNRVYTDITGNTAVACAADYESLVLHLYEVNPKIEIVGIFTTGMGYFEAIDFDRYAALSAERAVLRHYDIPYLYVGKQLVERIKKEANVTSDSFFENTPDNPWRSTGYFIDSVHPTDQGHRFYADLIKEYLDTCLINANSIVKAETSHNAFDYINKKNGKTTFFDPSVLSLHPISYRLGILYGDYFGNTDYITGWENSLWQNSNWENHFSEFDNSIETNQTGSQFAFRFKGKSVGFWYSNTFDPYGKIIANVYLVDKTTDRAAELPIVSKRVSCNGPDGNYLPSSIRLLENAAEATYEVRINTDKTDGTSCILRRVFVDGGSQSTDIIPVKLPVNNISKKQ